MIVTLRELREMDACDEGLDEFETNFGQQAEVTFDNLRRVSVGYMWWWVRRCEHVCFEHTEDRLVEIRQRYADVTHVIQGIYAGEYRHEYRLLASYLAGAYKEACLQTIIQAIEKGESK